MVSESFQQVVLNFHFPLHHSASVFPEVFSLTLQLFYIVFKWKGVVDFWVITESVFPIFVFLL